MPFPVSGSSSHPHAGFCFRFLTMIPFHIKVPLLSLLEEGHNPGFYRKAISSQRKEENLGFGFYKITASCLVFHCIILLLSSTGWLFSICKPTI